MRTKTNPKINSEVPTFSADVLIDPIHGLYVQDFFNERIYSERKRTERSKKNFLLMLLDVASLMQTDTADNSIHAISSVLLCATREIDLKGWYRNRSVIGVLFTEIDPSQKKVFKDQIFRKLLTQFDRVLGKDDLSKINFSFHFYPEDDEHIKEDFKFDDKLYPASDSRNPHRFSLLIKRIIDVTFSATGLLILSPFLACIACMIKATSKGPVFFKQERIGQFGQRFTFFKFRSMHMNLDPSIHQEYIRKLISGQLNKDSGQDSVYKITQDPRVTSFGRILRKTSLDELPQLVNVLRGEMSLVGPRPPIPYEFMDYEIWHRARVLYMRPGITGLWQILGRSTTSFNDMVRMDLKYMKEWSIWLDLKILLKTPWVVIACKGAY